MRLDWLLLVHLARMDKVIRSLCRVALDLIGADRSTRMRQADDQVSKGRSRNALADTGDEGRAMLRKAMGSCKEALIRGCPNGETHL